MKRHMRRATLGLAVICGVVGMLLAEESRRAVVPKIEVKVTGVLRTGLMAIGGETTGTTITANEITLELDLRRKPELREAAEKLDRQWATAEGTLHRVMGVERGARWVVRVERLGPAAESDAQEGENPGDEGGEHKGSSPLPEVRSPESRGDQSFE